MLQLARLRRSIRRRCAHDTHVIIPIDTQLQEPAVNFADQLAMQDALQEALQAQPPSDQGDLDNIIAWEAYQAAHVIP